MGRRRDEEEEELQEAEEGEGGEGEEVDPDMLDQQMEEHKQKKKILQGSAWLISAVVHIIGLVIMSLIVMAVEIAEEENVITAKTERQKPPYDPNLKRDTKKTPKIEAEKMVETPIVPVETEVEITTTPKGTSLNNASNKELNSTNAIDAFGGGGGAAGAYGDRFGQGSLFAEGGSEGTESAVDAALRWLDRHQVKSGPDAGKWGAADWMNQCTEGGCKGPSFAEPGNVGPGRGNAHYDVGVTALALLAFLGAGHTHKQGDYKKTVRLGLQWLQKNQDMSSGAIGYTDSHGESTYNHAIATMALCEACILENDPKLIEPTQKAVDFCIEAQNDGNGWKYGKKPGKNDTSVTGWMVLALKAAKTAGFKVPDEAFTGSINWFNRATSASGDVGYQSPGGGSSYLPQLKDKLGADMYDQVPCMTAVAVVCRIFAGQDKKEEPIRKGAEILMKNLPKAWDTGKPGWNKHINFYYWYYATYSMFQVGGSDWKKWNEAMQEALLPTQRTPKEGYPDADGSWDPVGEWAFVGGRVYLTAINALTLEIYYRYQRLQE